MLAVAERGRYAGIRHRHHDVDIGMALTRKLRAERLANLVDRAAADDGIGPREIDVFEHAGPRRLGWERLVAVHALFVEHHDLAGLDVANIARADHLQRAGLGGQNRTAVELAVHQRADAERVARADQLLVGHADQRIGALDRAQRFDEAVDETAAAGLRNEVQDHLGVGGRLHHGAVAHELAAQTEAVGEVAVVADRETAGIQLGEQRLHIAQDGRAGRRIAHMADRDMARQAFDHLAAGEGVADEAEPALAVKAASVEGDDAAGLLAAMLEGVQPERGDRGGIGVSENAEHATLFA